MEWLLDDPRAIQRRNRYRTRHGKKHVRRITHYESTVANLGAGVGYCNKLYDVDIIVEDVGDATCAVCVRMWIKENIG